MKEVLNKNKKQKIKIKIFLNLLLTCLLTLTGLVLITNSLSINPKAKLQYQEAGNVKYSVCLKENNFFEDECLNSNMSYIASLIKDITLDFNYQFNSNLDKIIESVDYEIIAKLIIKNNDTKINYYEKEYILTPKTNDKVNTNQEQYNLNKKIIIDYDYYNNIVTNFKSQYGVNSESYLEVYLNTYKNVTEEYSDIPTTTQISVQIPLSQKAVEIKFNTQEINKNINKTITSKDIIISGYKNLITGVILLFFSIICMISTGIKIKKHCNAKSNYDKFIKKILKEYDRIIVETKTLPNKNKYNIMVIKSFSELVDVRDNLLSPIMFYNMPLQKTSIFYILNNNNLYIYMVKEKNINNGENKLWNHIIKQISKENITQYL